MWWWKRSRWWERRSRWRWGANCCSTLSPSSASLPAPSSSSLTLSSFRDRPPCQPCQRWGQDSENLDPPFSSNPNILLTFSVKTYFWVIKIIDMIIIIIDMIIITIFTETIITIIITILYPSTDNHPPFCVISFLFLMLRYFGTKHSWPWFIWQIKYKKKEKFNSKENSISFCTIGHWTCVFKLDLTIEDKSQDDYYQFKSNIIFSSS